MQKASSLFPEGGAYSRALKAEKVGGWGQWLQMTGAL